MKALLTAGVAVAVIYTALVLAVSADIPSDQVGPPQTDVNQDGRVDALDVALVKRDYGQVYEPVPCVPYEVFDGINDPTYPIVNSLEEYITPRGGMYLIGYGHPAWEAYRQGTPYPLVRCAP